MSCQIATAPVPARLIPAPSAVRWLDFTPDPRKMELRSFLERYSKVQIPNVERSLHILETLAAAPEGLSLGELARRVDAPKSAAHRLLQALASRGYVQQDPASQNYAMSLKLAMLGFTFLHARHLPDVAQGALDRLARDSGEYCRIAVLEGESLVWIARAQGATQGLRYDPP